MLMWESMQVLVHIRNKREFVQVFCPDLPGCSATASSETEALRLLRLRIDDYFTTEPKAQTGTRTIKLEV